MPSLSGDIAMSDVIKSYLAKIDQEFKTGRATEHTHRPALKDMIEALDGGISATNEPKRVECGAPDFVLRREGLSIGYVETKDLGKSLDEAEDSDQLERYKKSLPNLILCHVAQLTQSISQLSLKPGDEEIKKTGWWQ
jgi:hypothetical protein